MQTEQLVYVYVQAFLNLYYHTLQRVDKDVLEKAHFFFKTKKSFYFLLESPLLDDSYKLATLKQVRINLSLPESFDNLVKLLITHKKTSVLQNFFLILDQEIQKRNNQISFVVSFAGQITAQQKNAIQLFLEQATGKYIMCEYRNDPDLIAGIRLQSRQFLLDDSIKGRLAKIRCLLKR